MEEIINKLINSDLKLISKETGIPYDRMYKWTKGKGNPKLNDYNVLMNYFNGKTSKPVLDAKPTNLGFDPEEYVDNQNKFIELPDGTLIMMVTKVAAKPQAGYLRGFHDPEYFEEMEKVPIEVQKRHGGYYLCFEVVGDSMVPEIKEENEELIKSSAIWPGWTVLARELPQRQWSFKLHTHYVDAWVIVHNEDGILIKNINNHNVDKGEITVHSLNPKYQDKVYKLADIAQIFSVVRRLPPQY